MAGRDGAASPHHHEWEVGSMGGLSAAVAREQAMAAQERAIETAFEEAAKCYNRAADEQQQQQQQQGLYSSPHHDNNDGPPLPVTSREVTGKALCNLGVMSLRGRRQQPRGRNYGEHGSSRSSEQEQEENSMKKESLVRAVEYLRRAAECGEATAQANLGVLHWQGWGVARSEEEAAEWWRKAAEQGHRSAQLNIGALYRTGRGGLGKSAAEAASWWRMAATQGSEEALLNLRRLLLAHC